MGKKYTLIQKRKWLEDYEKGYSESAIAARHHCDKRTLKLGLQEARHDIEARAARIEMLKNALLEHQEKLKNKLELISSSMTMLPRDTAILSWHHGKESIFDPPEAKTPDEPSLGGDIVYGLLMEHLKNEKLWRLLLAREQAYASHWQARIGLQRKVVTILESYTGLTMDDKPEGEQLCSYTAGDLFYRKTIDWAFEDRHIDWLNDIVARPDSGEVRYLGNILANASGKETECRDALIRAFKEMQGLTENIRLVNTNRTLEEATAKARHAIEEILVLGVILGRCRICKRLD
jgi:hypothetical protein